MITKTIKWGIIGAGDVCEVKSGPAFQKAVGSELVAVMRRTPALAQDFAQRHGVAKWYSDADALINDPDIGAIYIATPPDSHAFYVQKVADAGKIVYVEKPMARSYPETMTMIEACRHAGVPLYVAYYRRSMANFLKIKELLNTNTIGTIRFVNINVYKTHKSDANDNWRNNPNIAGGGYFHDLACHQLDILDFLLGPITNAKGLSKNQAGLYAADDVVIGYFEFESGVLGTGTWCFTTSTASENEQTTIVGSKGQISFPCFGDHAVTLELEGQASQRFTFDIPVNIQLPFIQSIVNEVNGIGTCPSDGISASRTNWVMDQICGL